MRPSARDRRSKTSQGRIAGRVLALPLILLSAAPVQASELDGSAIIEQVDASATTTLSTADADATTLFTVSGAESGSDTYLDTHLLTSGATPGNVAGLFQFGMDHWAAQSQFGSANLLHLHQGGGPDDPAGGWENRAVQIQQGIGNSMSLVQYGQQNDALLAQWGDANLMAVEQIGWGLAIDYQQIGSGLVSMGADGGIVVRQTGIGDGTPLVIRQY